MKRLVFTPAFLLLASCDLLRPALLGNEFYLICQYTDGTSQRIFHIDEDRREISELNEDGQLYFVCDGCETILSDSTIKWVMPNSDGGLDTTRIDRRTGKMILTFTNPNAQPSIVGGISVPAEFLGGSLEYSCEKSNAPPDTKF